MPNATVLEMMAAYKEIVDAKKLAAPNAKATDLKPTQRELNAKLALKGLTPDPQHTDWINQEGPKYASSVESFVARGVTLLSAPVADLFLRNSYGLPKYRYHKGLMNKVRAELVTPQRSQMSLDQTAEKLVTVMAECELQGKTDCFPLLSIDEFMRMPSVVQMSIIDAMWNTCSPNRDTNYDTLAEAMDEPDSAFHLTTGQLPSSIGPAAAGNAVTTFQRRLGQTTFTNAQLGIGFRADGAWDNAAGDNRQTKIDQAVARIRTHGMTPGVQNAFYMGIICGKNVEGTTIALDTSKPRINVGQFDIWNESTVCVARSFIGSTAFPFRTTTGGVVMWAVKVRGLRGFDTERWQVGPKKWRPGEKCFPKVSKDRIIGYTIVERHGNNGPGNGWTFSVPNNPAWEWMPGAASATQTQIDYINAELTQWGGKTVHIPTSCDFQN